MFTHRTENKALIHSNGFCSDPPCSTTHEDDKRWRTGINQDFLKIPSQECKPDTSDPDSFPDTFQEYDSMFEASMGSASFSEKSDVDEPIIHNASCDNEYDSIFSDSESDFDDATNNKFITVTAPEMDPLHQDNPMEQNKIVERSGVPDLSFDTNFTDQNHRNPSTSQLQNVQGVLDRPSQSEKAVEIPKTILSIPVPRKKVQKSSNEKNSDPIAGNTTASSSSFQKTTDKKRAAKRKTPTFLASIISKKLNDGIMAKCSVDQSTNGSQLSNTSLQKCPQTSTNQNGDQTEEEYSDVHMDLLWKSLLAWDFLHDLSQQIGSTARGTGNNIDNNCKTDNDKSSIVLPNEFDSPKQYKALWAPLHILETQSQILSQIASNISNFASSITPINVTIHKIYTFSDRIDLTIDLSKSLNVAPQVGDHGSILDTVRTSRTHHTDEGRRNNFVSNELVLISSEKSALEMACRGKWISPTHAAESTVTWSPLFPSRGAVVGLVLEKSKTLEGLKVTVTRRFWKTATVGQSMDLFFCRIGCNVTAIREFAALCSFDSMPLMKYVLKNQSCSVDSTGDAISDPLSGKDALGIGFRIYVNSKFNASQKQAIIAAAREYGDGGFTLVKGPPGTGKTTTLVAIINALHLRQYQRYYSAIERITIMSKSMDAKQSLEAITTSARVKPRILVCAPSNAAVDNIILKIMHDRFVDGNGGKYNPSILRIGSGHSSSVSVVSLQNKVNSIIKDGLSIDALENSIESYKTELSRIHYEIQQLQSRLRALMNACPFPLGREWEIRIDEDNFSATGRVLFVNHKTKSVQLTQPSLPEERDDLWSIKDMPHYRSCMDTLVKYVERHNDKSAKLERLKLVRNTATTLAVASGSSKLSIDLVQQLETKLIDTTDIVLTTLGSSSSRAMELSKKFEVIVIDEAAQSSELSSLTALQLGSCHAVLVGDPQQLPATIFSLSGRVTKFDRSLFQRLEDTGHVVHMLNIQYRCHPKISNFPRRIFYDGSLLDGANVMRKDYGGILRKSIELMYPNLQPLTMFNLNSKEEKLKTSLSNPEEAALVLHIFCSLNTTLKGILLQKRLVCVITPYSQQVSLLKKIFEAKLGPQYSETVEISTVDAFQGKERDIVILSCVRAATTQKGIGFLSDTQRMNVALTRAKHFLFIIARCETILVNPYWRNLVSHVQEQKGLITVPALSVKKLTNKMDVEVQHFPDLGTLKPI